MTDTSKHTLSFLRGSKTMFRGLRLTASQSIWVFLWINLFSLWFVGGGALMLLQGSTSTLPLVCVLTPLVSFPWIILTASKVGYSRLLGLPRFVPWLPATYLAVSETLSGATSTQPSGYTIFLVGFLLLNGICTTIDIIDTVRWIKGERDELVDTGHK